MPRLPNACKELPSHLDRVRAVVEEMRPFEKVKATLDARKHSRRATPQIVRELCRQLTVIGWLPASP